MYGSWKLNKRVPDFIFSGSEKSRFSHIAVECGFLFGIQMPSFPVYRPYFVDQDWKKPNRALYMAYLKSFRPSLATVLDIDTEEKFFEAMDWAKEASHYVTDSVIVIPKVSGIIDKIPHQINGKKVRLGYSVKSSYGETTVPIAEFGDREVHLLGGSIESQLKLRKELNVASADTTIASKLARYMMFFDGFSWISLKNMSGGIKFHADDLVYTVFWLSCRNMMELWYSF